MLQRKIFDVEFNPDVLKIISGNVIGAKLHHPKHI